LGKEKRESATKMPKSLRQGVELTSSIGVPCPLAEYLSQKKGEEDLSRKEKDDNNLLPLKGEKRELRAVM